MYGFKSAFKIVHVTYFYFQARRESGDKIEGTEEEKTGLCMEKECLLLLKGFQSDITLLLLQVFFTTSFVIDRQTDK